MIVSKKLLKRDNSNWETKKNQSFIIEERRERQKKSVS